MQVSHSRKTVPMFRDFRVERGLFRAEKTNWREAFAISHRGITIACTFDSPPPAAKPPRDTRVAQFRKGFFSAKTISQLIAEQGVQPVKDIGIFAGAIPDEDLDDFVADIYRERGD